MLNQFKSRTQIYAKYHKRLNFDNLFINHNWKCLELHKYNTKRDILNLSITKQLNFHKITGLCKEISYFKGSVVKD